MESYGSSYPARGSRLSQPDALDMTCINMLYYSTKLQWLRVNTSINSQFYHGLLSTSFSYRYPQLLLPLPGHIAVTESEGSVPLLHHHRIATVIGQSVAEMA